MDMSAYNEYFLNYLKNDRTGRAVMLKAPWGTGKSFYIRNELKPFLERKGLRCVVVSLYGMHSISNISKYIYLELRAGNLAKKSERKAVAGIIGKTIVKGVAGYFGVPLEINDNDLKKLYSSIKLEGKLIILEDLERSELDPVSVLGFVNSLVEDDGAKVLLVANESEIASGAGPSNVKYSLIKEKTIGDTIHFKADVNESVKAIITSFEKMWLKKISDEVNLPNQIFALMCELGSSNLRTLIFAIQKTIDIFLEFEDVSSDFFVQTLLGVLAYSIRINQGESVKWGDDNSARALGTAKHPLFLFAYKYINFQIMPSLSDLKKYQAAYQEEKCAKIEEEKAAKAMSVLEVYYVHSEHEVKEAVEALRDCLETNPDCVPIDSYGTLMNYLAIVRECLSDSKPIDECKDRMLSNAKRVNVPEKLDELFMKIRYSSGIRFETENQTREYNDFIQRLKETLLGRKEVELEKLGQVERFLAMAKEKSKYIEAMKLFSDFDSQKFADELYSLNASQLQRVRDVLLEVYCRGSNIRDYLSSDIDNLRKLKEIIEGHIKSAEFRDLIIKKQFEYLSCNLGNAITNLGGY